MYIKWHIQKWNVKHNFSIPVFIRSIFQKKTKREGKKKKADGTGAMICWLEMVIGMATEKLEWQSGFVLVHTSSDHQFQMMQVNKHEEKGEKSKWIYLWEKHT